VVKNNGDWRIVNYSSKGKYYDRASQYWISDQSTHDSISWTGSLVNRNDVKMVGTVTEKNGASFYKERVYNIHKAGTDVIENAASCVGRISWVKNEPPVLAPSSDATAQQAEPTVGSPKWVDDLTAAEQRMVDCLKGLPTLQDAVENAFEVEVRRYVAACGKEFLALLEQGGATSEESASLAEMKADKVLGCRIANPGAEEIQHTPEGKRMVTCSSLPSSSQSTTAGGTPVEPRAVIYSDDQTPVAEMVRAAGEAASLVRADAYRCDSISAFRPFLWGNGYKLVCNEFRYEYDEDKGGRWEVTVK
jgi:hypothetical protein